MFFNIKNRNQTGLSLYQKKDGEIYFVNGVGAGIGYRENLAGIIMKSSDNGATWSKPRKIAERGDVENVFQPINGMQYLTNGSFIIPSDSPLRSKDGASSLWVSKDGGQNWSNSKTSVTGIHAAIVESDNRELIAFGRRMGKKNILPLPVSSSKDFGESFESSNSIFPNIGGGQRASLIKTGPNELVLLSFTNRSYKGQQQMTFEHSEGSFQGLGMFVSVSEDNGETWPWKRLLTHVEDDSEFRLDGGGNTGEFILSRSQAEPAGYSVLVQAPNGVIHAFSSRLHYQFNVSWIKSLPKWR
jgi:Neuraminidase (sialidase)